MVHLERGNGRRRAPGSRGFTLFEMVIVLCVMVALLTLFVPVGMAVLEENKCTSAAQTAKRVHQGIVLLTRETGRSPNQGPGAGTYPSIYTPTAGFSVTGAALNAPAAGLVSNPGGYLNWRGPYLTAPILIDPWGRPFVLTWDYHLNGRGVVVANAGVAYVSAGPDGVVGTADDVRQYFVAPTPP